MQGRQKFEAFQSTENSGTPPSNGIEFLGSVVHKTSALHFSICPITNYAFTNHTKVTRAFFIAAPKKEVHQLGNRTVTIEVEKKTEQWLGATLHSSGENGRVVVSHKFVLRSRSAETTGKHVRRKSGKKKMTNSPAISHLRLPAFPVFSTDQESNPGLFFSILLLLLICLNKRNILATGRFYFRRN